jgi:hypothetical protein
MVLYQILRFDNAINERRVIDCRLYLDCRCLLLLASSCPTIPLKTQKRDVHNVLSSLASSQKHDDHAVCDEIIL